MEVLVHHIYEYEKGLRNLILHTTSKALKEKIEEKLNRKKIPYIIHDIPGEKINIYFGNNYCIDVVKSIDKVNLSAYTDEEDYILGIKKVLLSRGFSRKELNQLQHPPIQ